MIEIENRLREKIRSCGHPVMSEEELNRYRSLEGDAKVIASKTITADLQKQSGRKVKKKEVSGDGSQDNPFNNYQDALDAVASPSEDIVMVLPETAHEEGK